MRLYLASRSPRRRELLTQMGVAFDTLIFRGGLRSRLTQQMLVDEAGMVVPRVAGGYKAMRRFLLDTLDAQAAQALDLPAVQYDEAAFRYALNADAMATEKLAEGIRAFAADTVKLEQLLLAP